jgi:hypothetical protein
LRSPSPRVASRGRKNIDLPGAPKLASGIWHGCCSIARDIGDSSKETTVSYTYYDYLEVAPGAPASRIEMAYAQILERFGYGVTESGQDLSNLVRLIHAAYDVLSDPEARRRYDAQLEREAAAADAELKTLLDREPQWPARRVQDVPLALSSAIEGLAA